MDEDTGKVTQKAGSKRVPGDGWDVIDTGSDAGTVPRHAGKGSTTLKLGTPIERSRLPARGQLFEWRMIDSFKLCWPVIQMAVKFTNLHYDQQSMAFEASWDPDEKEFTGETTKKPFLGTATWPTREVDKDTGEMTGGVTEDHYLGFLAIIGFMGLVRCRDMAWHWSTNPRMQHPFVRKIMGRDYFLLFRRFLHFCDSTKRVPRGDPSKDPPLGYDQIYNFRPVMDACNAVWLLLVAIVLSMTYDEQMIKLAMQSKLSRRQPNKLIRDGIQVYFIAMACGLWCYCCWIDQGQLDPALRPPYVYG